MSKIDNMDAARGTYGSFINTLKWFIPFACALTALIIYLIS